MKTIIFYWLIIISLIIANGCKPKQAGISGQQTVPEEIQTNPDGKGQAISLRMIAGPEHNHPLMAAWVEDLDGNYLQSLFVANSIATGVYRHGQEREGKWAPGPQRRPAALPRWAHQRGVKASDGLFVPGPQTQVADAYTGATPQASFVLRTKLDKEIQQAFKLFVEVNQSWDWNTYWTNNKFPDDPEYKTSSQPAVVYSVVLDPQKNGEMKALKIVGHSHYSGKDGRLYEDTETLTTALEIFTVLEAKIE